jgi:hypothetical protein
MRRQLRLQSITPFSIALAAAVIALAAFPLAAPAAVYPGGGGAFAADAEGWQATEATCNIPLAGACSASGGHDSAVGNPAGSLAAEADIALNLGGLFDATVVLESPDFTVAEGGSALLHLDRQFESDGLVALAPEATYSVNLTDRATETPTQVLTETLDEGDGSFAGKEAVASVAAGHTYALSIEVEISSATAGIGLVGAAIARFDNVALTTEAAAGEEEGTGSGAGDSGGGSATGAAGSSAVLTSDELRTVVRRGDAAGVRLLGHSVFVRLRCPRRAPSACRIVAQGAIKRRVRVTQRRSVRIAKGRSRVVALRVKPRFRDKLARRKRLLVVQRVRAGEVATTFARSKALIRRR